jgi:uncharacterized protein YodC (DUF2158 family)
LSDQIFNIGDVVTMRRGGPLMTVFYTEIDESGPEVHCKWTAEGSEHQRGFAASMLTLHPVRKLQAVGFRSQVKEKAKV